jgi:hypothetical protein
VSDLGDSLPGLAQDSHGVDGEESILMNFKGGNIRTSSEISLGD